jgi:hypothetical protein
MLGNVDGKLEPGTRFVLIDAKAGFAAITALTRTIPPRV